MFQALVEFQLTQQGSILYIRGLRTTMYKLSVIRNRLSCIDCHLQEPCITSSVQGSPTSYDCYTLLIIIKL